MNNFGNLDIASEFSFGAAMGVASGYILRQGGKVLLASVGTGFVFLQTLSHLGYADVNWNKVEQDYHKILDVDGDGKITSNDFKQRLDGVETILSQNIPGESGFASGLMYGLTGSLKAAGLLGGAFGAGATAYKQFGTSNNPSLISDMADSMPKSVPTVPEPVRNFFKPFIPSTTAPVADRIAQKKQESENRAQSFSDQLQGKSLDDLRTLEEEFRLKLIFEGGNNDGVEDVEEYLWMIENAKVVEKAKLKKGWF